MNVKIIYYCYIIYLIFHFVLLSCYIPYKVMPQTLMSTFLSFTGVKKQQTALKRGISVQFYVCLIILPQKMEYFLMWSVYLISKAATVSRIAVSL